VRLADDCLLKDTHRRFDKYKDIQIAVEEDFDEVDGGVMTETHSVKKPDQKLNASKVLSL